MSESAYDKESSQVHIFSPEEGGFSSSSKPSPSSKFAAHKRRARGQSLDRGSPVRGKLNRSLIFLFYFMAWPADRGGPAYLPVLHLDHTLPVRGR